MDVRRSSIVNGPPATVDDGHGTLAVPCGCGRFWTSRTRTDRLRGSETQTQRLGDSETQTQTQEPELEPSSVHPCISHHGIKPTMHSEPQCTIHVHTTHASRRRPASSPRNRTSILALAPVLSRLSGVLPLSDDLRCAPREPEAPSPDRARTLLGACLRTW